MDDDRDDELALEVEEIHSGAALDDSEFVIEPETEIVGEPITVLAQTTSVRIYDVSCSSGATTKFLIPVMAFGWRTRLGYFRADGGRITLSPIFEWNQTFYPGYNPSVRFRGRLPAGTKDLRAFWWYEGGPTWWNKVRTNC